MNMPPVVIEATKYIWDRYPPAQEWTWPIALSWTHWHASMGYLGIARDNPVENNIVGVVVIRPVNNPGDGLIPYEHDENGQCLFIDMFACDNPVAYALLSYAFVHRFGPRRQVAYLDLLHRENRGRRGDREMHIRPYDRFKRRVEGRLPESPFIEE